MYSVHRSARGNICVKRFELFCEKRRYINLHIIIIVYAIFVPLGGEDNEENGDTQSEDETEQLERRPELSDKAILNMFVSDTDKSELSGFIDAICDGAQ